MTLVWINLGQSNQFKDIAAIPERFHREFTIETLDDESIPDWPVSKAIREMGVWEPMETTFLMSAFAAADGWDTVFLDLGCNIGWYGKIAETFGLTVDAVDCDARIVKVAQANLDSLVFGPQFIDEGWTYFTSMEKLIVKMDLEGNERHAVEALRWHFETHAVTHCLMEVSPCFRDSYPELLWWLINGCGYRCHVMPHKQNPPPVFTDAPSFLLAHCRPLHGLSREGLGNYIRRQHQINVILSLPESRWG